MFDTILAEAIIHNEHTLMRRKLRPFCLWHRLLLEMSGTPLMFGDGIIRWVDIELVARICATRFQEQPERPGLWWSYIKAIGLNYHEQMASFHAYLKDYSAFPEFWEHEEPKGSGRKTRPTSSPMPQCLSITSRNLMLGSANTLAEAWEMPVGLASFYAAAYSNMKGADLDWKTPAQRKMIEEETANPGTHFKKGPVPENEKPTIIIPGGYNGGKRDQ